jgi:hypothetical protein
MPLRLGSKKEKRSYLDKGPTKEQQERRDLVRGRLFGDDISTESDDSDLNIPVRRRQPPRRSRSASRGPSGSKRGEKLRSRSTTGLIDMRKSLLRKKIGINLSPPPSPKSQKSQKPEKHTDDIMSNALKRVQERRKKKIKEREVLMETIMMEDGGGAHYDYDSVDPASPIKTTTNIFYRGLQALEEMYLE